MSLEQLLKDFVNDYGRDMVKKFLKGLTFQIDPDTLEVYLDTLSDADHEKYTSMRIKLLGEEVQSNYEGVRRMWEFIGVALDLLISTI